MELRVFLILEWITIFSASLAALLLVFGPLSQYVIPMIRYWQNPSPYATLGLLIIILICAVAIAKLLKATPRNAG